MSPTRLLITPALALLLLGCRDEAAMDAERTQAAAPTTATAPAAGQPAAPAQTPMADRSMDRSMAGGAMGQRSAGQGTTGQSPTGQPPMGDGGSGGAAQQHTTSGTVTAIDLEAGTLTVAHEAVPDLQWPAMTMGFELEDTGQARDIEVGDEVRFSFSQEDNRFVIHDLSED